MNHAEAMGLAATEYDRLIAVVDKLGPDDWHQQTDNDLWDVRAMLGHVLGTMDSNASVEEAMRQRAAAGEAAAAGGGHFIDALSALQVEKHAALSPAEMVDRLRAMAPQALRGRSNMPPEVLATSMTPGPPFVGEWTLGFLIDVIYTRDTWMHRIDLCRATGHELVLTEDHDGRIVADVVAEWARTHDLPFTLVLAGPAGGTYTSADLPAPPGGGDSGEHLGLDAVEFCRILSGRGTGSGLLAQGVPF
ncbi:MAG: hypothetical protein QOE35_815 [Actinomycetota bacterium]|jgi:uncharacterized protein (TIGR03083 family)